MCESDGRTISTTVLHCRSSGLRLKSHFQSILAVCNFANVIIADPDSFDDGFRELSLSELDCSASPISLDCQVKGAAIVA